MTEIEMGERLESGQEWTKLILALIGAVTIGGVAFLGIQINRLDGKFEALGARIDAHGTTTRQEFAQMRQEMRQELAQTSQELVGIANAISNSITAARQVQPQVIVIPAPGSPPASPNPQLPRP